MARFDVFEYAGPMRLVVDVQASLLSELSTRVVIPLWQEDAVKGEPVPRLKPTLRIGKSTYVLMTTDVAAVPCSELGECIVNLEDQRQIVIDAMDFLFQGF